MKIFRKSKTPLTQEEITEWLRDMRGNPYVPASNYDVSSVFRAKIGDDDTYYFAGVNVENPHHRLSSHGEEGSIAAMVTALGKKAVIVEGWVMAAPRDLEVGEISPLADNCASCCGKCRQQIAGFADPSVVIHSISLNGAHKQTTVGEFLPDAFTFKDFIPDFAANTQNASAISAPTSEQVMAKLIRTGKTLTQSEIKTWLNELESVDYASKTSQSVIVKLANGAYVAGTKVEEAAFVSIDPMQAAMAIANAKFGLQKVVEVHTFGKGRDEKALSPELYSPLTGSAVQVLAQFAANPFIPVHMYNGNGKCETIHLVESLSNLPTFEQPNPSVNNPSSAIATARADEQYNFGRM